MTDAPFSLLPLGAIIQSFVVDGTNIVQGFPTPELYESHNTPYFGETIGRVANRTKGGRIDSLNGGKSYTLATNNGPNHLHGGNVGWGKRQWNGPTPVGIRKVPGVEGLEGGESVKFTLVSPDGEEGYPGTVHASVVYTAGTQLVSGKTVNVLAFEYEAELVDGAEETAVNITNHSYFNLGGGPLIDGTVVELATNKHLPVDEGSIPTGGPTPFPGVDTSKPFTVSETEPFIDHCFIVNEEPETIPIDSRSKPLTKLAAAHHPVSKIHLEVLSTEPAFQFYTGDFTDVPAVEGVAARKPRSAFCVEPSRYVNAVNVDEWKHMVVLKKGEKYGSRIVYRGWKE